MLLVHVLHLSKTLGKQKIILQTLMLIQVFLTLSASITRTGAGRGFLPEMSQSSWSLCSCWMYSRGIVFSSESRPNVNPLPVPSRALGRDRWSGPRWEVACCQARSGSWTTRRGPCPRSRWSCRSWTCSPRSSSGRWRCTAPSAWLACHPGIVLTCLDHSIAW